METLNTKNFRFAEFELDGIKRLLLRDGEPVSLNPKAFEVLLVMVESRGDVLTKDDLLDKVWPDQIIEEGNLKVHISALRKALGQSGNDNRFIVTVPGRGYTFVADLEDGPNSEIVVESHSYSNIVIEEAEEISQPRLLAGTTRQHKRWLLAALASLMVTIVAAGYWLFLRSPSGSAAIKSVAVMPFVNDSGNVDLEYLSDGLTESLIGSLSRLPELSVKARTSIARYKGEEVNLQKVGSDLGVETILTGRMVQRGDDVVLYVEFVEPATEKVLWKADYHRPIKDIAALETDISRDVAKRLKTKLSGEEDAQIEKYQTDNSEAYQLYLRGAHFSSFGRMVAEKNSKGIEYLQQAIALDPNYAAAYVELGLAYIRLGDALGMSSSQDVFPKAREALTKALSIDDDISAAHRGLAIYYLRYEWNWPASEREFQRAMELDPEDPDSYSEYAVYLVSVSRFDEALRMRETAKKLLPPSAGGSNGVGFVHYHARNYERSIECFKEALDFKPDFPPTRVFLARSYLAMGKYQEAIAEIEKAVNTSQRNIIPVAFLSYAYFKADRRGDADKLLGELEARAKKEYIPPWLFAMIHSGAGHKDRAFEYLEQARLERQPYLTHLKVDPAFDNLRSDPRFGELVKKIGIPD
jgi:DNA-binding winged helix-turn-helix (wHTH) protein/TolB-like protein/Tfp pilus assembly protein PilF